MNPAPPLIFIHYGPAAYLRLTLRCALRSNPDKRIVFIGDQANRIYAQGNVDFCPYRDLECAQTISEFHDVFQVIQGSRHHFNKEGGTETWLKFVFLRWFLVCEFLQREKIESFWIFDSDTLLLAPLTPREKRFAEYAATTQCRDTCLNGFVASRALVEHYTKTILELFRDQDYLSAQRDRLKTHAGLAFNEMDAFGEFRRRQNIRTFHAAQPIKGEVFDDALAFTDSYVPAAVKVLGKTSVKKLWISESGGLYARTLQDGAFLRLLTCNMSWMPDYLWKKMERFCLTPEQEAKVMPAKATDLREIDLSQPLTDKVARVLKKRIYEMKRAFGR